MRDHGLGFTYHASRITVPAKPKLLPTRPKAVSSESCPPERDAQPRPSADRPTDEQVSTGKLGLAVFLLSLSMLFAASIAGYLVVRLRAEVWRPPGMPPLPGGLWLSTALILLSSGTIQWALSSVRRDRTNALRRGMLLTSLLAGGFLVCQIVNWTQLARAEMPPTAKSLYAFTFYMLTALHAAHVLGGMVPLAITTVKSFLYRYTSTDHAGVLYCAIYWHFLDVVWIILFAVLLVSS